MDTTAAGLRLAAVGAGVAALVAVAGPAAAHDSLTGSDPAAGQTLTAVPDEAVLTFSGAVQEIGTAAELGGPDGPVATEAPVVDGSDVRLPIRADLPAGDYEIVYRVTSSDGHPISGTVDFTVEGTAAASPTAPAPAETTPAETTPAETTPAETTAPSETTTPGAAAGPDAAAGADAEPAVTARDDTGTNLVLPVITVTFVGLIAAGLAFANAAMKRRQTERRL